MGAKQSEDTAKGNKGSIAAVPVIDGHCDVLLAVIGKSQIPGDTERRNFQVRNAIGHMDLPRLVAGGVRCQFMALFAEDEDVPNAHAYTHRVIDEFEKLCTASGGAFFPVRAASDLDRAVPGKSVGGLLSIEGAEALEGSLDALDEFYARGVRAMGITWNRRNAFGRGVKAEGTDGLTALGKECVGKMERLGMLVDVSHLSDPAFDDIVSAASGPLVASHSNARAVCGHNRNLTDDQIREIARRGGVVGCVFVPSFITPNPPSVSYLESLCDHIVHVAEVGGVACAGLGSDFEGYSGREGTPLKDCSEFPLLAAALAGRGFSGPEIGAIMGGNWSRVIGAVLK